ncbi:MAG: N-acetyltransferase [Candidatus Omnitrophota bacterium]|jgi:amino-acid N-acetyltransferase|nr:MAG: N-acetyltransferase [Candidatus Omnitrophota bacterium]
MIRKAKVSDIPKIQNLINKFAEEDLMLPRSLNELFDRLRDFIVIEERGRVIGCSALHICWQDLAELRSLAVEKKSQSKGIGTQLVASCIEEAKDLGAKKLFVLTYKPDFFKKFGFRRIKHADLPHKVWAECINCPKFPDCQEVALIKNL